MRRATMRIARTVARLVAATLFGGFVTLLGIYILQARALPDLGFWHSDALPYEFDAEDTDATFESYLAYESMLFEQLATLEAENERSGLAAVFDRFTPGSRSSPTGRGRNWNRTFVLEPETVRGGALLLHGLSDSPYSLRAVGEVLHRLGFYVVGLRVPGHGTMPGALTRIDADDWEDAVGLAAAHVADIAAAAGDAPFVMAGYSNGSALAVNYTLRRLERDGRRVPDRLILLSPALTVSRLAALARVQLWLAHVPGLSKLAWTDVLPEFDPFKYNSFPVNAGRQIYRLTSEIRERVLELTDDQRRRFPPVLAFGSVVDATVPPTSVLELTNAIGRNGSEVVFFDINRVTEAADFIRGGGLAYLGPVLASSSLVHDLTIVTNATGDSEAVVARTKPAGTGEWNVVDLGMSWPRSVYSLSHVAIPFRPDDPLYGATPDPDPVRGWPPIGSLAMRGERGIAGIPLDLAMRLRHNPFFEYVETRIEGALRRR